MKPACQPRLSGTSHAGHSFLPVNFLFFKIKGGSACHRYAGTTWR